MISYVSVLQKGLSHVLFVCGPESDSVQICIKFPSKIHSEIETAEYKGYPFRCGQKKALTAT